MSDQPTPPEDPKDTQAQEGTEPPPPYKPDLDAITYIERGPSPREMKTRAAEKPPR